MSMGSSFRDRLKERAGRKAAAQVEEGADSAPLEDSGSVHVEQESEEGTESVTLEDTGGVNSSDELEEETASVAAPSSVGAAVIGRMSNANKNALILSVDVIDPDPTQPRISFEEIEEKAESIKEHGQLQAITVRPHPDIPGRFMVVDGERRWRAMRSLAESDPVEYGTLKAELRDDERTTDAGDRLGLQLIANIQRDDLKPLEMLDSCKRLMELKGFTKQSQLASYLGKSKSYISKIFKLDKLSDEEKEQVESGEVSARDVREAKKGEEVQTKAEKAEKKQTEQRDPKVSISKESAVLIAEYMQRMAEDKGLTPILLEKFDKKELTAIIDARASEIFE